MSKTEAGKREAVTREYETKSSAGTVAIGRKLAELLTPPRLLILRGDLGAGKTTLVKGIASALGAAEPDEVTSPTFTLVQTYDGPEFPVVHADFYRLRGAEELTQLGWEETLDGAVALVEWPELAASALPADRLEIALSFDPSRGGEFRRVEFIARGAMADVAGGPKPKVAHRFFHVPASNTAVGHLILENAG